MESESGSPPPEACDHKSWEIGVGGKPVRCTSCGHVFDTEESEARHVEIREFWEAEEEAVADAAQAAQSYASSPPAPTGGGKPYAVAYYFTVLENGVEHTRVREVAVPVDASVECVGNTLVIHHEGVADTFRIGRVRPLEA